MSNTKEKLEEAKFFLEQLEEHYRVTPQVRYYLSAYISAARSVLWVMRHEYQDVLGWEEWFTLKRPDEEKRHFLKTINDLRVQTAKLGPIKVRYMLEFLVPPENLTKELEEFFERSRGKELKVKLSVVDPNDKTAKETIVKGDYVESQFQYERSYIMLDEFPEEDILDVCKSYYSMIEQLVIECEERFGKEVLSLEPRGVAA